jgi:starch phosphorylase
MSANWKQVQIQDVSVSQKQIKVGSQVEVTARINLGALKPDDVCVQLYYGELNSHGEFGPDGQAINMAPSGNGNNGQYTFKGTATYNTSGERGVSVRVLPNNPHLSNPFLPGLITWANSSA